MTPSKTPEVRLGLSNCFVFTGIPKFPVVQRSSTPMNSSTPHYLLHSTLVGDRDLGRWRFVLRAVDGSDRLEAEDAEPAAQKDRLELLAVVRGLEALDQPSRVTLTTPSTYVREGIRYGLSEWRRNGWRWEFFGQMVPVKNCDLWQRVDTALRFHKVECRTWRFDQQHPLPIAEKGEGDAGWHVGQAKGTQCNQRGAWRPWVSAVAEFCRTLSLWGVKRFRSLARVRVTLAPSLWTG
jgi:ribonuclease HI